MITFLSITIYTWLDLLVKNQENKWAHCAHLRGRSLTPTDMRPFRPVPFACDEELMLVCDVPPAGDTQLLVLESAMDPGIVM